MEGPRLGSRPLSGFLLRGFQPPARSGFWAFRVSSFVLSEKVVRIRSREQWRKVLKGLEGVPEVGTLHDLAPLDIYLTSLVKVV